MSSRGLAYTAVALCLEYVNRQQAQALLSEHSAAHSIPWGLSPPDQGAQC